MTRIMWALSAAAVLAAGAWVWLFFFVEDRSPRDTRVPDAPIAAASGDGASGTAMAIERAIQKFDPPNALEPDELLIVNPPDDFTTVVRQLNFSLVDRYTFRGLEFTLARVRIPRGMTLSAARAQLAARIPSAIIDYNYRFDASASAAEPKLTSHARAAIGWHDLPGDCGRGIVIGMIDSGVDESHPILKGQDLEFRTFHSPQRRPGDDEHGTAVAALLIGKPTAAGLGGLLPGATLKAANMFERNETGFVVGNAVAMMRALDWLVRERVQIINLSLAGNKSMVVERGIKKATDKGITVVAAAGNWGRDDIPAYPAAYDQVVAVTAVDAEAEVYQRANRGNYIDFAAPGVTLLTAAPGGGSKHQSGTSFAAPFLTAMLALEIANGEGATTAVVRSKIAKLARDLGPKGRDPIYGWGLAQIAPKC